MEKFTLTTTCGWQSYANHWGGTCAYVDKGQDWVFGECVKKLKFQRCASWGVFEVCLGGQGLSK